MNYIVDLDQKILDFIKIKTNFSETQIEEFKSKIHKIIELAVENENINADEIYVSISSASTLQIQKLNKEYRNIDKVTDVLSFPVFTRDEINNLKNASNNIKHVELGDIIICLEIVEKHATEYITGIYRETLYMITHGICHLLGYDHIEKEDKAKMRDLEEKILNQIGVK